MENPVGRAGRGATEPPETTCDVRSETLRLAQWASHLQNSSVPPLWLPCKANSNERQ